MLRAIAEFVPPCLPMKAPEPPTGSTWLHEIKHDGFRVIARKHGPGVKLYSRPGNDLTHRLTLIVEAIGRLRARSCIIDGESVACRDDGVASFDRIRYRRHDASGVLPVLLFKNRSAGMRHLARKPKCFIGPTSALDVPQYC